MNVGRTYYNESRASVSAALRIDRRRHAFDLGEFLRTRTVSLGKKTVVRGSFRISVIIYNLLIGRCY